MPKRCRASRGWVETERVMRLPAFLCFSALLATGCRSIAQHSHALQPTTPDIAKIHPAPGTSIVRFEQLDEGVYKGSKPKTQADYQFLESLYVKYIVELRLFPLIHEG